MPTSKQLLEIFMKELRLATKIITTLVKDRIHYLDRLIAESMSTIARCGVLLLLYWYVFNLNNGVVNNTPYIIVAWSMFFYFAFSTLNLRNIARVIMQDVQSGTVEVLFSKPISYLSYRVWWQIGSGLYSFLITTVLGSIILSLIVGIPDTMTIGIFLPSVFLVFIGASILTLLLYGIVGLLAFWIEEINPIYWIVDKAVMILGGSYLPISLFPPLMYKIALYSPFGASFFVSHIVLKTWQNNWYILIGIQLIWIIILGICISIMFAKAKEKVSVNGG